MAANKKRPPIDEELYTDLSIRTLQMKLKKPVELIRLLVLIPQSELGALVSKYLPNKKRPSSH